ncbi:transposase, IS4 family protein [Mycobacterium xenopi 3993]|nr:transposase, IS4 family protein [Mycobacterium xenopi 3993]
MFLDIDSLLRPVYGHAKQGASFGHAKIASRALLRLGLSPQITTISTATAAPVIAEAQLRSGKAASGAVPHTSSSRRSPPRKRSTRRADPGARRLNVWHQESDHHLHSARRRILPVDQPQQAHQRRDRRHRRGRLDPVHYPARSKTPTPGR